MITGEIKNRIDSIWDTFWIGGYINSITILEQMTYLFFMKMLDDAQRTNEANAGVWGTTICDPAMGSAGFIVESAKYIHSTTRKNCSIRRI